MAVRFHHSARTVKRPEGRVPGIAGAGTGEQESAPPQGQFSAPARKTPRRTDSSPPSQTRGRVQRRPGRACSPDRQSTLFANAQTTILPERWLQTSLVIDFNGFHTDSETKALAAALVNPNRMDSLAPVHSALRAFDFAKFLSPLSQTAQVQQPAQGCEERAALGLPAR
jgi:hypothetical protein